MKRNDRQYTAALAGTILLVGILTLPVLAQANGSKGASGNQGSGLITYLATLPVEQVSTDEIEGLLFTREEEKLARDVTRSSTRSGTFESSRTLRAPSRATWTRCS